MKLSEDDRFKLLYPATISLIVQSEAATWARLTHFTTAAVAGCAAWGYLKDAPQVRTFIGWTGLIFSVVYFALALRSRYFVGRYVKYGKELEKTVKLPVEGETLSMGVLTFADPKGHRWPSGTFVAPLVPLLFFFVYLWLAYRTLSP